MALPRVVLIGGPPGAGKTTLARSVASALGYAALSADDLAVAARAVTSPKRSRALHPMAGSGHTRYFTESTVEGLIEDAQALQDALWPAVERVVRLHETMDDPVVIDWWLLAPDLVASLRDERVGSIWLHVEPSVLTQRERANAHFFADSPDPQRMLDNFMGRSLWRNRWVASEARRLGLPVLHQDGSVPVANLTSAALDLMGRV